MARGRGTGKKSGSKPTSKGRSSEQQIKDRYAHAREDAQLAGLIPTTPEEALKSEVAPPCADAALPELVRQALRDSWATPDAAKRAVIASLLEPFFTQDEVMTKEGVMVKVKRPVKMLIELANTLRMLDETQYERDHPRLPGVLRGPQGSQLPGAVGGVAGTVVGDVHVNVTVQTKQEAVRILNELIDDPDASLDDCSLSDLTGPPGEGRYQRKVEGTDPPALYKQSADEGLEDSEQ